VCLYVILPSISVGKEREFATKCVIKTKHCDLSTSNESFLLLILTHSLIRDLMWT